jgi:hypothetical protein
MRSGLIDPDTPQSAMTKTAKDGKTLQLVVGCTVIIRHPGNANTTSSPTNSTSLAERFTTEMTHTSRLLIFGMEQPKISSGTIQMPCLQRMEHLT